MTSVVDRGLLRAHGAAARRGRALRPLVTVLAALLLAAAACGGRDDQVTVHEVRGPGGRLEYRLFVPRKRARAPSLVVVLHGCAQDPDEAAAYTRFDALASRAASRGLVVLYPRQDPERNPFRCWNWYVPAHQQRGRGEPALIVKAVEEVVRARHVDRDRVFVTGLSAGSGMSAVLGACYPDVFAAIGLHSGPGYQAGLDTPAALAALQGQYADPDQQGERAHLCAGAAARVVPVIAIHGRQDREVDPGNAAQAILQFAQADDLADDGVDDDSISASSPEVEERSGYRILRTRHAGGVLFERYDVFRLGHRWSGASGAGSPGEPDATRVLLDFFAAHPRVTRPRDDDG